MTDLAYENFYHASQELVGSINTDATTSSASQGASWYVAKESLKQNPSHYVRHITATNSGSSWIDVGVVNLIIMDDHNHALELKNSGAWEELEQLITFSQQEADEIPLLWASTDNMLSTDGRDSFKNKRKAILDSIVEDIQDQHLVERITYLFIESLKESDEYQEDINLKSLKNFINFINKNTSLKKPNIVLTPSGNLRAAWKNKVRKFFKLEFLPTNEDVKFVVFAPNKTSKNKDEMVSGKTTSENVLTHLTTYGINDWAFDKVYNKAG